MANKVKTVSRPWPLLSIEAHTDLLRRGLLKWGSGITRIRLQSRIGRDNTDWQVPWMLSSTSFSCNTLWQTSYTILF